MSAKLIIAADCETDPFLHGRVPLPFIWGAYDGRSFYTFRTTKEFVEWIKRKDCICFFHNGGKFDVIFLLNEIVDEAGAAFAKAQVINGRIISIKIGRAELRDSYAIIPEPLKKFGGKKDIEYWKLEGVFRDEFMEEITNYLYHDCLSLYQVVTRYREVAGKQKTIASNALTFAKTLGIDPGKTNYHFDRKFRRFYYGGRCECFRPGTHKNIKLIDIHSAYPFAMEHEHPTGTNYVTQGNLDGLTIEELQRSFIVLQCRSNGAFAKRDKMGGLCFPKAYEVFNVTGWEYLTALDFGLIDHIDILECHTFANTINFKAYTQHWYGLKSKCDKKLNPVDYTIFKILLNSLYGKLAQNPMNYYDYRFVKGGTPICFEPLYDNDDEETCSKCGDKVRDHGWLPYTEFDGHAVHRRESLWRIQFDKGAEWENERVFKNVATGASITGFTRAHLLRAMQTVGREHIIYGDTDGLVCDSSSDLSGLAFTDTLGDWELEATAPIGHFAGKKLYGIDLGKRDKEGKPLYKIASKGSRLAEETIQKIIRGVHIECVETNEKAAFDKIVQIVNGESVTWRNSAPTFNVAGKPNFVVRNIQATA